MATFDRTGAGGEAPQDPPELREQIDGAVAALEAATAAHDAAWHIGGGDWSLDQDVGDIVFTMPNGTTATAPAQIIGTYSTRDGTWLWAWDHPSVAPPMAEHARRVQAYGQQHGYARLTTRKLQCTEEECWELTALAFMLCGAQGAYRGPAGPAMVFMTFGEVRLSKRPQ